MVNEISPVLASQLALGVYQVNSNNERQLKAFLANRAFSQREKSQSLLKAEVGGRILRATKDGFGVCARGAGQYQNDLFLVFRGTTTANKNADVITDARIGITRSQTGLPVHIGFNHTFDSMLPDIRNVLMEAKITGVVHCIGHSLGGAVASLAADWIASNTPGRTRLYTFGAPRVGTDWFVKTTTKNIRACNMFRVYHRTDPVSMVALYPFMQAPYQQKGYFIGSTEPLASGASHSMAKYVKSVEGKTWVQLSDIPDQPYSVEAAIESWLKSTSPVTSASSGFWRWLDSALIFVLKKIAMASLLTIQGAFIGTFTLADKIAYILAKGIDLADNTSIWVEHLMRKMMQALGVIAVKSKKQLTRNLITDVLRRITKAANEYARNALRNV